jgi:hypothetical protein
MIGYNSFKESGTHFTSGLKLWRSRWSLAALPEVSQAFYEVDKNYNPIYRK